MQISAVTAFQATMHDTSTRVRHSALATLGAHGGGVARPAAREALVTDSSDRIQAMAILYHRSARHRLRRAAHPRQPSLAMPSYQNVIQTAALQAIAQMGDMSFILRLEHVIDQQEGVV
jgi:hypothetical protein